MRDGAEEMAAIITIMCLCSCVCICLCARDYGLCSSTRMYVCLHARVTLRARVCVCVCVRVFLCVRARARECVCVCVCDSSQCCVYSFSEYAYGAVFFFSSSALSLPQVGAAQTVVHEVSSVMGWGTAVEPL